MNIYRHRLPNNQSDKRKDKQETRQTDRHQRDTPIKAREDITRRSGIGIQGLELANPKCKFELVLDPTELGC